MMDGDLYRTHNPAAAFPEQDLFTYTPFTIPGIDFEFVNRERRDSEEAARNLHFFSSFVSDVHWGTKSCHAKIFYLMQLLTSERELFCLGDMPDLERLALKDHWNYPDPHIDGLAQILRKAVSETVRYLPGNHDALVRKFLTKIKHIFGVQFAEEFLFPDASGGLIHAAHGDRYDDIPLAREELALMGC